MASRGYATISPGEAASRPSSPAVRSGRVFTESDSWLRGGFGVRRGGGTDNQRPGRGSRHVELESRGARRLNDHFAVLVDVSESCASSQTNSRVLPLLCRPPASSASPRLPSPRSLWLRREGNRFMRDFTRVDKNKSELGGGESLAYVCQLPATHSSTSVYWLLSPCW